MGSVNAAPVPNIETSLQRRATSPATLPTTTGGPPIASGLDFPMRVQWTAITHTLFSVTRSQLPTGNVCQLMMNIRLWFNAPTYYGSAINTALESYYISVNSFNCPDY